MPDCEPPRSRNAEGNRPITYPERRHLAYLIEQRPEWTPAKIGIFCRHWGLSLGYLSRHVVGEQRRYCLEQRHGYTPERPPGLPDGPLMLPSVLNTGVPHECKRRLDQLFAQTALPVSSADFIDAAAEQLCLPRIIVAKWAILKPRAGLVYDDVSLQMPAGTVPAAHVPGHTAATVITATDAIATAAMDTLQPLDLSMKRGPALDQNQALRAALHSPANGQASGT